MEKQCLAEGRQKSGFSANMCQKTCSCTVIKREIWMTVTLSSCGPVYRRCGALSNNRPVVCLSQKIFSEWQLATMIIIHKFIERHQGSRVFRDFRRLPWFLPLSSSSIYLPQIKTFIIITEYIWWQVARKTKRSSSWRPLLITVLIINSPTTHWKEKKKENTVTSRRKEERTVLSLLGLN